MSKPTWDIANPWPYFFRIERDLLELSEYVTFSNSNENCFGERVSSLIILIGSEIDTNLRVMCGNDQKSNMKSWKRWLTKWNPKISSVDIANKFHFPYACTPFEHLDDAKGYAWWDCYNAVKHNRYANQEMAHIRNLMELTSALFCVNAYASYRIPIYYQDMFRSRVFEISMLWDLPVDPKGPPSPTYALQREPYLNHIYSADPKFPCSRYFNLDLPMIDGYFFQGP